MEVSLSATVGYGIYYVCRLSLNVVKKPIVDSGTLTETELGIIGSALFITYAVGKFVNGFLADRVNVRRFMSLGLLAAALVNLILGFSVPSGVFIALWAINGWVQSMGAPAGVVAQSRWIPDKQRGRFTEFGRRAIISARRSHLFLSRRSFLLRGGNGVFALPVCLAWQALPCWHCS